MGLLVKGEWYHQAFNNEDTGGNFVRADAKFRNWMTPDGTPGPSGESGFAAAAGRYHLYVPYAGPWAHRTLIYRKLKSLEGMIDVSYVHYLMGDEGWTFDADSEGIVGDGLFNSALLYEVYLKADPNFSGRVIVPVLWDKHKDTIVSN